CGRNWEGLCLLPRVPAAGQCAGFAASKRDGQLVCLVWQDDRLAADPTRVIPVTHGEALSGCTIAGDRLFAGTNLVDTSKVYRVTGCAAPATAKVEVVGRLGSGFPEAIAATTDGALYRFSDTSVRPSAMDRYLCRGAGDLAAWRPTG